MDRNMSEVENDHAKRWDYIQELLSDQTKRAEIKRRYIQRRDDQAHGWIVNIRVKGIPKTKKFFSDEKNAGSSSALLAAVAYRNKKMSEFGLLNIKGLKKQPYSPASGGVFQSTAKRGDTIYHIVIASWVDHSSGKNVRKTKQFSINKYGLEKALSLAKKFRVEKLKEIYG